jgi:2-phospho-L-lactate transferase/gluconeogenesis factor (CofD/UPF0052 family)
MAVNSSRLSVVLFSGGRGSSVLSRQLISHPNVELTLAINGYDDGASTGEVRRFLGDSLGPSDFRKNASHLARETRSCPESLTDLLDWRLPVGCTRDEAFRVMHEVAAGHGRDGQLAHLAAGIPSELRAAVSSRLERFQTELETGTRPFEFSDFAMGNLVFAGSFLAQQRRFNDAVDEYCGLLGLPPGLIENVTDGTNAYLVALDVSGRLLGSEAEIVDARRQNRIKDIFLVGRPVSPAERQRFDRLPEAEAVAALEARMPAMGVNPRLLARLAAAHLIIYSPGTQHSSLFPSYVTPGLSLAIAAKLTAIKLLVTNIQADAEIAGSSAVDIIERAVYYLKEKGRLSMPTPSLITHYIVNDPGTDDASTPYVPLGSLDAFEDPRLVRIGHYEDGVTGRHDASKVLTPFLNAFLERKSRQRIAVWLYDGESLNKISQSILEMLRGGLHTLSADVTVFCTYAPGLDERFVRSLPFPVRNIGGSRVTPGEAFCQALREEAFDYAVIFESSGMYRGEDIVGLISPLMTGRLSAVWGSRRLSVKDIEASYRLRYRHSVALGAISYIGSHLLSLAYLLFYGRYVSDTLSGARAVSTAYLTNPRVPLDHKLANQYLLTMLLREKADLLETPVQFLPLSPERVRRTGVLEGLQSLRLIVWQRILGGRRSRSSVASPSDLEPHVSGRRAPL